MEGRHDCRRARRDGPSWHTKTTTARRVKGRILSIMRWAIRAELHREQPGQPRRGGGVAAGHNPRQHDQALPYEEIVAALQKVRESDASLAARLLSTLTTLTAESIRRGSSLSFTPGAVRSSYACGCAGPLRSQRRQPPARGRPAASRRWHQRPPAIPRPAPDLRSHHGSDGASCGHLDPLLALVGHHDSKAYRSSGWSATRRTPHGRAIPPGYKTAS